MSSEQNTLNANLESLDDANPVHQALLTCGKDALVEVFRDFVFTDVQVETIPTQKKGAPFPHNAYFYMNANRMNALVCVSLSQQAFENTVKKILGESEFKEADAADAAQELSNIFYGSIKKRMQINGYSFGLATYQFAKLKPLTPLLKEEVRYGYEFFVNSDLGPICAKILYDTVAISFKEKNSLRSVINHQYLDGYQSVRLGEFVSDEKILFDIFIHLKLNNKLILYKRGGDRISNEVLKRFHSYHIETVYIKNEDQSKFVEYIAGKAANLIKDKEMPLKEKQDKVEAIAKNLVAGFFTDTENVEDYLKVSHEVVNQIIEEILQDDDPFKKVFAKLQSQLKNMETHACDVQALSTVMAMVLGYTSEKALASIALGSLFHDIGYSKLPKELHNRDENGLTPEEFAKVKEHPQIGVDIINNSMTDFSYETKLIIQQHHERHDGSGYPLGIKGFQMYELSKVVGIANELDNRIRRDSAKPYDKLVRNWWEELSRQETKKFDPVLFKKIFSKLTPEVFTNEA
ncbi:MAG: HD-GYP domain-containing protein [Bdellovibrionia bacterium]